MKKPRNFSVRGFAIGFVIGLAGWIYYHNLFPFTPTLATKIAVVGIYGALTIITFGITIFTVANKKAAFGTFVDGLIIGAVTAFDILYVVMQVALGNFPFSVDTIIL